MSKLTRSFLPFFTAFLLILQIFNVSAAQSIDATVSIDTSNNIADVRGRFLDADKRRNARNFYFRSSPDSSDRVSDSITDLKLLRQDGKSVEYKTLIPGEFLAAGEFEQWSYKVALTAPKRPNSVASVSWINGSSGLIMLDDLFPQTAVSERVSASIVIEVPAGWQIESTETEVDKGRYRTEDVRNAIFVIGRENRVLRANNSAVDLKLVLSGEWLFTDAEALAMAAEIYDEYKKLFGMASSPSAQVTVLKFPVQVSPGNWQAETRGRNVTVVSSDMNFRTQSLQRLHEQLRHELFHLWLPNAVNLTGNYDWFYEGFALYQSLKTAVSMNRIRFDDFLDTLSRAYSIDLRNTRRMSLVEASKARFAGNDTQIYARGMLVAFLTDISLLEHSKGKVSTSDVLRKIAAEHSPSAPAADANAAIIRLMMFAHVDKRIIDDYIIGNQQIDWNNQLLAAGIRPPDSDAKTGLSVVPKPTGRQKTLLNKLGYNNWRKLSYK